MKHYYKENEIKFDFYLLLFFYYQSSIDINIKKQQKYESTINGAKLS